MDTDGRIVIAPTRARRWFWLLLATSILLMGMLYRIAKSEPGPSTAALFLLLAVLLLGCTVQAARVWRALEAPARARRRARRSRVRQG